MMAETKKTKGQEAAADVSALLRARHPLIVVRTNEEARAESLIMSAAADGTLILGNLASPGCKLTQRDCEKLDKPFLAYARDAQPSLWIAKTVRAWIAVSGILVLNVAGNREETNPGIGIWAEQFIRRFLENGQ